MARALGPGGERRAENVLTPQAVVRRVGLPPDEAPVLERQLLLDTSGHTLPDEDPFHNPNFADVTGGYRI